MADGQTSVGFECWLLGTILHYLIKNMFMCVSVLLCKCGLMSVYMHCLRGNFCLLSFVFLFSVTIGNITFQLYYIILILMFYYYLYFIIVITFVVIFTIILTIAPLLSVIVTFLLTLLLLFLHRFYYYHYNHCYCYYFHYYSN